MSDTDKYTFKCLCGKCGFTACGAPVMVPLCHCKTCRVYGGGPAYVAAFMPDKVTHLEAEGDVIKYESAPNKFRYTCKTCGTWIYNTLPNGINALPLAALEVESGPKLGSKGERL
ncbi:Mss4-like protein [Baffinella frigidus]|nr:Mss4-like protein [Cryptophyta sp. CCMP2293]